MAATISLVQRAATAGSYKPGQSGNLSGKRRGTANRVTIEAREAATLIVDDAEYRESLRARMLAGTAAHMEPLLWAYAKGRPVDRVEVGGSGAFEKLTDAELRDRMIGARQPSLIPDSARRRLAVRVTMRRSHESACWHAHRPVRNPVRYRCGRYGRGLSGA